MHIGFTDITSKITGTTVNVNRIYDSTVKESGDFGYGWSMSVQGLKIYESASLAEGYGMVQSGSGFSTRYQMVEKKDHDVTVTYGDGTSDRFELTFSPAMGVLRPIQEVSLGYKCVTNQKVKLEILTDTSGAVSGGNILFYENGVYDTINYRLTTENGEKLYLNKNKGVYRIEDSLGHKITVDANGYHGEDGRSIEVKRDSKNRVTEAIDVNGNKTIYKYDAAGDLISVTDSADRTVSYTYDKNHNLISIIDPMGVAVSRNEYDDEGRLVASIDADGNRMEFSHDVEGRSEIIKDRRGNATQYVYDDNGNVIQTKDPYGNVTKNEYDANNNCISKTDAKGHTTGFSYDANGNCTKVTAPDGTVVENSYSEENYVTGIKMLDKTVMAMTYDSTGYLKSLTDANGNEMDYDYSKDGQLIGMTDSIGVYQKMTYDSEGNVLSTTNGAGESAYYTYDDNGRCTGVTIKRTEEGKEISFTSRYTYDDADNVVQSVDNSGNVTTYEYDKDGNQVASVDAKNRRISYEYDNQANLIKTVYPDGTSESFEYDANGNNVTAMDRSGLKVTMEYDKLDRLVSKTYADGNKESYKYDAVGNLIEQTSITGARTTYAYDECDRNISITDTFGRKTTFAYDSQSKLISRTDCKNNKTTYTYDDNGNITKTTYPDGFSVTAQYDARNRIVSQADQNGYTTKYEYDAADKLTKVTDANGNIYTYSYDENGNLVKVTDPLNHSTEYTYDAVGHVASVKNAAGKVAEYDYDSTGKLVSEKDYAGNRTEYSYDDMDRVSSKKTADNEITYTYTDEGLLSAVKDKSGTVSYKYDKYNRLTAYTNAENITVSYEYDKYGNVSAIDNGFKKTQYEYDKRNRLTRVIDHNGKATVYEYDELGNRSALRYPNGDVVTYTYDKCQRLKTELIKDSSGKQIAKYTYTLGKAGERTRVDEEELSADTDSEGNEATVKTQISYTYDRSYRLTREVISRGRPYLNIQYSYDKASNRTMKYVSVNGDISLFADVDLDEIDVKTGKTNYTFNELNQLLSAKTDSGETTAYTYDDNGNLIKEQGEKTKDYKYDSENHLVSATVQQGNSLTSEDYTYDYAGNRTSKIVNELDVTKYVNDIYSDLTYVLAETDKDGKLKKSYTRGDELISSEIGTQSSGNNSQNTSTQNGTTNSTVRYFINDGHGSVRYLTDSEGKVTDRYTYDGYGNLLEKEGDTENDFLYTGEQYNYTTELYYLRARYMDPSTGTFISMDSYAGSLSDPISLHKYLYCHANPIMNTDPSGNHISVSQLAVGMGLNISEINAEVVRNAILIRTLKGAAIGAVAGAVLGGIDSALSGNGIKQVLFDTIKGALGGMCVGAVIAIALIYATVSLPVFISLKIFSYGMLITGALGVVIAAKDDNIPLALFRAITTLVSFFGFSSVLKNIKFTSWTDPSEHYLHRPYIRKGTMDAINEKTRVDYETGEIYDAISNKWVDPSEVELGHTKGNEFWYWRNWAERHGMTQADFNDFMNNPDFYAWQDIICNRSHQFEDSH
ncbi:MAG: hypothetical protein IKS48_04435 [Eubacterium sp.]|nr:hypothetical protein [Eubacterium sp.]